MQYDHELKNFVDKDMTLDEMAEAIFGCSFSQLNWFEQEMLYTMANNLQRA